MQTPASKRYAAMIRRHRAIESDIRARRATNLMVDLWWELADMLDTLIVFRPFTAVMRWRIRRKALREIQALEAHARGRTSEVLPAAA